MVNENKGIRYSPRPVYDRKLARSVLRAKIARLNGNHKVNETMGQEFRSIYRKG